MQHFVRRNLAYLLIIATLAFVLAAPTRAGDKPKPPPTTPAPFKLTTPSTYRLAYDPTVDPADPAVVQMAPGYPNSVRAAGLELGTVWNTRYFGIFLELDGCCNLRINIIVYRIYTKLAAAVWWGPFPWPCLLPCAYTRQMQDLLLSASPAIPADKKYCWGRLCVTVHPRASWRSAVNDRPSDLVDALIDTLGGKYCLALTKPRTNWTIRKHASDGCRKGY